MIQAAVQDTTLTIWEQIASKGVDGIEYVANQMAAVAPDVWRILVQQAFYVEGMVTTIMSLLLVVIPLTVYKTLKFGWNETQLSKTYSGTDGLIAGTVCGCIGSAVAIIFAIVYFKSGLSHMLNPEYYALMDILNAVKP